MVLAICLDVYDTGKNDPAFGLLMLSRPKIPTLSGVVLLASRVSAENPKNALIPA
jgi:hypothetical protein